MTKTLTAAMLAAGLLAASACTDGGAEEDTGGLGGLPTAERTVGGADADAGMDAGMAAPESAIVDNAFDQDMLDTFMQTGEVEGGRTVRVEEGDRQVTYKVLRQADLTVVYASKMDVGQSTTRAVYIYRGEEPYQLVERVTERNPDYDDGLGGPDADPQRRIITNVVLDGDDGVTHAGRAVDEETVEMTDDEIEQVREQLRELPMEIDGLFDS